MKSLKSLTFNFFFFILIYFIIFDFNFKKFSYLNKIKSNK